MVVVRRTSFLVICSLFAAAHVLAKPKGQSKFAAGDSALELQSICEEAENQFRWIVENPSSRPAEFSLRSSDSEGVPFEGIVGPNSSLSVITYRKWDSTKGADTWILRSRGQRLRVERNTSPCPQVTEPPVLECPLPPEPVVCTEPVVCEPTVCPPPPESTVCPEPIFCEPTFCPPPPEPTVCPEPVQDPGSGAGSEDGPGLTHPCLDANDPIQSIPAFDARIKVRTDLTDSFRSFTFFEEINFGLRTCESISIFGRFAQSGTRNSFNLDSRIHLGSELQLGATKMALLASDGSLIQENVCDLLTCELNPFLLRDLQGNFGLGAQTRYFIVIDYDLNGALSQKVLVINTD